MVPPVGYKTQQPLIFTQEKYYNPIASPLFTLLKSLAEGDPES